MAVSDTLPGRTGTRRIIKKSTWLATMGKEHNRELTPFVMQADQLTALHCRSLTICGGGNWQESLVRISGHLFHEGTLVN